MLFIIAMPLDLEPSENVNKKARSSLNTWSYHAVVVNKLRLRVARLLRLFIRDKVCPYNSIIIAASWGGRTNEIRFRGL